MCLRPISAGLISCALLSVPARVVAQPTSPSPETTPAAPETSPTAPETSPSAPPASAEPAEEPASSQASATEPAPVEGDHEAENIDVTVHSRKPPPSRGASDFRIDVGELRDVPRRRASELLTLAPGFFLTSEGGTGHADRIYLRGFDAREGQDIELWAGSLPINETGHFHGNGFADTSFIIPEFVTGVRVLEGPFDPAQGNFAVAGSASYELGLTERGILIRGSYGTENTARLLFAWGPEGMSTSTFAGGELSTTEGYGENRGARKASAMAQVELPVGSTGSLKLLATAFGADYESAGALREDDLARERKGFYDTYDTRQGGSSNRFGISADLHIHDGESTVEQILFAFRNATGLRQNLTGFLLDQQEPTQAPHGQRGDLFDLDNETVAFGAKGSVRYETKILDQKQAIELGYFARGDVVSSLQQRLEAVGSAPYKVDADLDSTLGDFALFTDAQLSPVRWLTLRGGLRGDLFLYDVRDNCAVKGVSRPQEDNPPGEGSCFNQSRFGTFREPDQRSSTSSLAFMPRGTILLGPFEGFTISASVGRGVRSIDPSYISQDVETPFADIVAGEGGIEFLRSWTEFGLSARSIFFGTHVDKDQIFSETEGRSVIGGGTTRSGWAGSVRVTGDWFDVSTSVTLTKSAFDDTGLLVPYVPDVVVRHDGALFHDLPLPELLDRLIKGRFGLGLSVIGQRALPFGQRSDAIVTLDSSVGLAWKWFDVACEITNLPGLETRLSEYNYTSDFKSQPAPTLVPARHFVAGAPRQVLVTVGAHFGG